MLKKRVKGDLTCSVSYWRKIPGDGVWFGIFFISTTMPNMVPNVMSVPVVVAQ